MLDTKQRSSLALAVCIGALAVAAASFWWLCVRSPKIDFLSKHAGAEWVIYPKPPDAQAHFLAELSAEFRRSFVLGSLPARAQITARALRRFEITVNGQTVAPPSPSPSNWKTETVFEVGSLLRVGTNDISVTVFNDKGLPALWLAVDAGSFRAGTGEDWDVSLLGAVWRKAWPAAVPMPLEKGHALFGGEDTVASFIKQWPALLLLAGISVLIFFAASRAVNQYRAHGEPGGPLDSPRFAMWAAVATTAVWAALFLNNLKPLPNNIGFDVPAHLDYIDYLRTHHSLPLATDGWEMCQPPLYYIISALILTPLRVATESDTAIMALRIFGLLIGVLHFTFVFLGSRLLFPKQVAKQLFCLLFAAFVPEQLYLAQYITNESLAATLVTGAIYFCLKLLNDDAGSARTAAAIGLCLGGALLTKASAVVAAPFILGMVTCWPIIKYRTNPQAWLRTLGVAATITIVVGGGHYLRVWKHFGTPLVHDWDAVSGFAWWTDTSYHTASSAFGFGESLSHPFYSSFHSFADGIYSTLWGDGLYGGETTMETRPPWNYELMAAGYLLALVPTLLILTGVIQCIVRFIRRPQPVWFLLLGTGFATFAALLYMNLKLPFFCNAKAFYGSLALFPICAAGAIGLEALCKTGRMVRAALFVLLGLWALTSFSSFWIRRNASSTHAIVGMHLCPMGRLTEASGELSLAQSLDGHELRARRMLALVLLAQKHTDEARQQARQILSENPNDAKTCLVLAKVLADQKQLESACHYARRALELEPSLAEADKRLCEWLAQLGKNPEAIAAAQEGLRLDPTSADLHFVLGSAYASFGDRDKAIKHFGFVCNFSPQWPQGHNELGVVLAAQKKWDAAASQFSIASRLKPDDADFRLNLAIASESGGKTAAAVQTYREALKLNPNLVTALNKLAWILATCPDDHLRDGKEAVRLAEHACELTGSKTPRILGTLAAAYAEAGRYTDAIASAQKAIDLASATGDEEVATGNKKLLELYRANRPCRQ